MEFRHLDIEADLDDTVEEPKRGAPISNDIRRVLELSPAWTKWPDYERVSDVSGFGLRPELATLLCLLAVLWSFCPTPSNAGIKYRKQECRHVLQNAAPKGSCASTDYRC